MSELERLEERLRLLNEGLWYIKWSTVFVIFSLAGEAVALMEIATGHQVIALKVLGISLVPAWIGIYLRKKSLEYRRKADGEDG